MSLMLLEQKYNCKSSYFYATLSFELNIYMIFEIQLISVQVLKKLKKKNITMNLEKMFLFVRHFLQRSKGFMQ